MSYSRIVTWQSIFSGSLFGNKWKATHAAPIGSLINLCLPLILDSVFLFFFLISPPPLFYCLKTRTCWFSAWPIGWGLKGCCAAQVHRFHLPVCQMSRLADFHRAMVVTKWGLGGAAGGCTCHWMPIWLQSTISTEAPTKKQKSGQSRGLWWHQIRDLHKTYKVTAHTAIR